MAELEIDATKALLQTSNLQQVGRLREKLWRDGFRLLRLHITHYILHDKMAHCPLNLQLNEQEWLCRKTVSLRWCVLTVPEVLYLCHAGERCMTVREYA